MEYRPSTLPGSRTPHAPLPDGRSLFDLFGSGFTLLRLGDDAPDTTPIARSFAARGVPLTTIAVGEPAIRNLYERALVLVRPDGHVAWRGDTVPGDPLALVDRVRGAASS